MNYMEQLAQMLGVELDEEFRVEGFDDKFMLASTGMFYYDIEDSKWQESLLIYDILKGTRKIIKMSKPILNEKEKEHLSNVIKPFRDRVKSIRKCSVTDAWEWIQIQMEENGVILPCFEKGTMYKGMEVNKEYNLEDLGL